LRPLFGLKSVSDAPDVVWSDRYLRLRDETVLQCHGPADLLGVAGAETLAWYEAMHEAVRARDLMSVNGREWCDFNDARRTVQLERVEEGWQRRAERPIQGLTLLWPERVQGVCVNGHPCVLQRVAWGGVDAKAMTVDVDPSEVLTLAARTNNL